ncbi:hypothetical protein QVD17_25690 [Tagetes erecta]|uniref:Putative plant transposon protein domain-containing protein n=1 Tax=Tagetes erecta TaxID=13708 RepID=A0AAD8KGY6_TARER|nr:hypothetical protein QVD17_25690 [Tagetes erecta]
MIVQMPKVNSKGKAAASSSGQMHPAQRERMEKEERIRAMGTGGGERIVEWMTGSLEKKGREYHMNLFEKKMNKNQTFEEAFLYERVVDTAEFRDLGIVQKFEALGWEAALNCYDGETEKRYLVPIMHWVGSLRYDSGRRPPQTIRLIGEVDGVEVVMSRETLSALANFDSKPNGRGTDKYIYPSAAELFDRAKEHPQYNQMLNDLFPQGGNDGTMRRNLMKMTTRLLLLLVQQNILPRRSDRGYIRTQDVQIVHSLLTGSPRISFMHLVMQNIWYSRNKVDKRTIPYCRLITALLKSQRCIDDDMAFVVDPIPMFDLAGLRSFGWRYEKTARHHRLINAGVVWQAVRTDVELSDDEEDEEEIEEDENREEEDEVMEDVGGHGLSRQMHAGMYDYYANVPAYHNMQEYVEENRPLAWATWDSYQQHTYDLGLRTAEEQRYANRAAYNRQEEWNRSHAFNQAWEVNLRWQDDERRRQEECWRQGTPWVENPPIVDYSTLPPYDGTIEHPVQTHHSPWIDPIQYQQQQSHQQQGQGSSSDPFDTSSMSSALRSMFGDPQPPYY